MPELTLLSGRYERAPLRPPVVVQTKLRPPRLARGLVPRPRLLRALDEGAGRALTLVVAPAGYGKTTLLAQWRAAGTQPVAWVSLDEPDRDLFRLWAHVGRSLAGALPQLRPLASPELPLDVQIPRLAEAAASGPPAALILDDFHRLGRGASAGTLSWFAERAAPALQVVIASRVSPAFGLGLLRARGLLLELGADDLRLTDLEELALCGAAREGMEGWPAGVRAADPALLARQALARLGDDERSFLLRASILDELTAPLCDAVLGRPDAAALLRMLERETPFLVPVDGRRCRYRLHRALGCYLRQELERADAAAVQALHARAAAWERRHGDPAQGLEHALAAGDGRTAAALVRRTWRREVDQGRHEHALAQVERLPDGSYGPRLELVRAWLLHLAGRRDDGRAALAAASAAARGAAKPLVDREAALVEAAFCWDGRAASTGAGPVAAWASGWARWWRGDLDEAEPLLESARRGPAIVACAATAVLSRVAGARGARERALVLARDASARAAEHGLELGLLPTALGVALAARGHRAAAVPLLEEGLRLRREWGHPFELADGLLVLAPLVERARAAELLAEARALIGECGDPGSLGARLAQAQNEALPRPGAPDPVLSERELIVLRLLAAGRTKRAIGDELHLSFNTVHSHAKSIYRKLAVSTRAEAVGAAEALGLC